MKLPALVRSSIDVYKRQILILRAKYELAVYSVEDRRAERYREAVDECYAFKNEFPESKYTKEADRIFKESQKMLGEGGEEQE